MASKTSRLLAHLDLGQTVDDAAAALEQIKHALREHSVTMVSLFRDLDVDQDGMIILQEFERGLQNLGLSAPASAIQGIYEHLDADGSGRLSLKELNAVFSDATVLKPLSSIDLDESPGAPPIVEQLHSALMTNAVKIISLFKAWDQNADGVVTCDEFELGLRVLGLDVPRQCIQELHASWDDDGSGKLSLKELSSILNPSTVLQPLKHIDLDESPDAPPINDQLHDALSASSVHILDLFNTWDASQDGLLSRDEFETGLRTLGLDVPSSAIHLLFWTWDRDRSGMISMQEMAKILQAGVIFQPLKDVDLDEGPSAPPLAEQLAGVLAENAVRVLAFFKQWDADGNGLVEVGEFETGLRALGLDVATAVIHELFLDWDDDHSGSISFKELSVILQSPDAALKPLATVDLDESPGAPPISEQLKMALASNAVTIIKLFKCWDLDGDGVIDKSEFEGGLRALGLDVPLHAIQSLFSEWDKDGSGELTLREITAVLNSTTAINELRVKVRRNASKIAKIFKQWDLNGDGIITRKEFHDGMLGGGMLGGGIDQLQLDAIFDALDIDGSDSISYVELMKVLRRNPAQEMALRRQRQEERARSMKFFAAEKVLESDRLREEMKRVARDVQRRLNEEDNQMRGVAEKRAEEHSDPTKRWQWARQEQARKEKAAKKAFERQSLHMRLRLRGTDLEPEHRQGHVELQKMKTPSSSRAATRHCRLPKVSGASSSAPDTTTILSLHRRARHAPARRHCHVFLEPIPEPKRSRSQLIELAIGSEHMKRCYSLKDSVRKDDERRRQSILSNSKSLPSLPVRQRVTAQQ